nr:hypothetical protein [Streptomyces avicenniae]
MDVDDGGLTPRETDRLRTALGIIGAEAGRGEPADALALRGSRRAGRRAALAVAAAVGTAALAVGVTLTGGSGGGGPAEGDGEGGGGGVGLTVAEAIACAAFVGEGEVTGIRPSAESGRIVLGLDVREALVPAGEGGPVELDILEPDPATQLRVGQRVFVTVYEDRDAPADFALDGEVPGTAEVYRDALPAAEGLACPEFWTDREDPDAAVVGVDGG